MSDSSKANESSFQPSPRQGAWLNWARMLLLIAIAGAGYLAWVSLHNGPVAGCGTESGCSKVLQSRWAYWMDIPVSTPALLAYLALFGSTILLKRNASPDDQRGSWAAIIVLSLLIAGAALWFVSLQVFVLKSFCKFCMTAHVCGFLASLICLKNIPFARDPTTPMWTSGSGKQGIPSSAMPLLILLGLCGVGVLAGGQLLFRKELNVVKVLPLGAGLTTQGGATTGYLAKAQALAAQYHRADLPNSQLVAPRVLSLYSNKFQIKLDTVPMMGPSDAPNVIVCIFDYTCPHCRALHPILAQAQQRYGNRLGIVCLPMPVSTNCNAFLPPRIRSVPEACEYSRLGLAVWRAKPGAYRKYEDWVLAPEHPLPVTQARQYAAILVGEAALQAALSDPWIDRQIAMDCELHRDNSVSADTPVIPQLIIGDFISSGTLNSADDLGYLLSQKLNLLPDAGK